MRRILLFASLLLALLPHQAVAQRDPTQEDARRRAVQEERRRVRAEERARVVAERQARTALDSVRRVIRYDVSTGAMQNVPLISGRRYQIVVEGLNPLCYKYGAEVYVRQESPDLTKLVAQFGSLAATGGAAVPKAADVPGGEKVNSARFFQGDRSTTNALGEARGQLRDARETLATLRQAVQTVEAIVAEVNTSACSANPTFGSIRSKWNRIEEQRNAVSSGSADINNARMSLDEARTILLPQSATEEGKAILALIEAADTAATNLENKLAEVLPKMSLAQGAIDDAEDKTEISHAFFLPANADSVALTVTVTPLYPPAGTTPTPVHQTASLAVRHGMRMFLSIGGLASALNSHDFQRVNRPCAASGTPPCDSTAATYSTYADQTRNRGFAFSPVLQANVAFRDVMSSGVSLHTSLGVAARSVNGSVSPEFILGAGTGFVDRFLITLGLHYARDEKLLIGHPSEVARTAVPSTITDADAISTIWRPALGVTVTVRLPGS